MIVILFTLLSELVNQVLSFKQGCACLAMYSVVHSHCKIDTHGLLKNNTTLKRQIGCKIPAIKIISPIIIIIVLSLNVCYAIFLFK